MPLYPSPEEMYTARANRFKRDADRHWAMAKSGQGDYHYGKAKFCYFEAANNREKAAQAHADGSTFGRHKDL